MHIKQLIPLVGILFALQTPLQCNTPSEPGLLSLLITIDRLAADPTLTPLIQQELGALIERALTSRALALAEADPAPVTVEDPAQEEASKSKPAITELALIEEGEDEPVIMELGVSELAEGLVIVDAQGLDESTIDEISADELESDSTGETTLEQLAFSDEFIADEQPDLLALISPEESEQNDLFGEGPGDIISFIIDNFFDVPVLSADEESTSDTLFFTQESSSASVTDAAAESTLEQFLQEPHTLEQTVLTQS